MLQQLPPGHNYCHYSGLVYIDFTCILHRPILFWVIFHLFYRLHYFWSLYVQFECDRNITFGEKLEIFRLIFGCHLSQQLPFDHD